MAYYNFNAILCSLVYYVLQDNIHYISKECSYFCNTAEHMISLISSPNRHNDVSDKKNKSWYVVMSIWRQFELDNSNVSLAIHKDSWASVRNAMPSLEFEIIALSRNVCHPMLGSQKLLDRKHLGQSRKGCGRHFSRLFVRWG